MALAAASMAISVFSSTPKFCSPTSAVFPFTQFTQKKTTSLKFSSSSSVAGIRPLVCRETFNHAGPVWIKPQPPTVFCAKGYKMKTHKASAKRFRVSGSGKIMRRRAGKQHLNAKKNTKRKLRLSKMVQVDRSDYDNVIGALPYLKVNRSN
ncbi:50S ribosomal protein L35, chloroplastic [Andrographis paniculata]|uniref:50S ribosomal protein L35, chloroplastic n=1 Tax=Andrographis paniculata TaxID=175694 RepID=UPI0021E6F129|nr:50S ribosomal protein L35, chloroplastic [Andrographis paniculata]